MFHKIIADFAARADHHVQHPCWQTRFFKNFRQQQATCDRCVAGGFQYHAVAAGNGGNHRTHAQVKWEIPRADDRYHAQGLAVIAAVLMGNVRWQ